MGATPDQLKSEIDRTRGQLAANVDGLTERVSPTRIAHRRTRQMRGALTSVRDRVMGTATDTAQSISESTSSAAGSAAEAVRQAPDMARARTQGNPLAMGLIAFGAGMIAAALVPTSREEEKLGSTVKEKAREAGQPIADAAKQSAQDMADELKPQAQQAMQDVKDRAGEAARATADQARGGAGTVADDAKDAAGSMRQ